MRNHVRKLRLARNLSQAQLAALAHTSEQQIQLIEYGKAAVTPACLQDLCEVLDAAPRELFPEEGFVAWPNNVLKVRVERKLTQVQLARMAKTTQQQIQRIETGKTVKQPACLNALCEALGAALTDLFPGSSTVLPLGNHVRKVRIARHLTQPQLADLTHCSQQQINRVETGQGPPPPGLLFTLCVALGVEPPELFPDTASAYGRLLRARAERISVARGARGGGPAAPRAVAAAERLSLTLSSGATVAYSVDADTAARVLDLLADRAGAVHRSNRRVRFTTSDHYVVVDAAAVQHSSAEPLPPVRSSGTAPGPAVGRAFLLSSPVAVEVPATPDRPAPRKPRDTSAPAGAAWAQEWASGQFRWAGTHLDSASTVRIRSSSGGVHLLRTAAIALLEIPLVLAPDLAGADVVEPEALAQRGAVRAHGGRARRAAGP